MKYAHRLTQSMGNYTSVLLGEQAASKTARRSSTLRARAKNADVAETESAGLVNRLMLVQIQSSAPFDAYYTAT